MKASCPPRRSSAPLVRGLGLKAFLAGLCATATLLALPFGSASSLNAQPTSVATVPEGYVTLSIAAGTGTSRTNTVLSLPLLNNATLGGIMSGRITGVTANTITNSAAGWTSGALSVAASPNFIRITSGDAIGRTFLISTSTQNTSTTITLDSQDASVTDLTTLGIVANITSGDTYQIISGYTISMVFGTAATTGILANSAAASADQIQLYSSSTGWTSYFNNTTNWRRVTGPTSPANNIVLRPDAAVIYSRLGASQIDFILRGKTPSVQRVALVANSGVTFLASFWPTNVTLANSNITNIPGWVTNSAFSAADSLQIYSSATGWRQYFHNGTNWRLSSGPTSSQNNVVIPVGAAVIISKRGSATGQSILTQSVPYSL